MTQHLHWLTAGLVFPASRAIDMTGCARHAAATLETLGHKISGLRLLSDGSARITTCCHTLRLTLRAETAPDGTDPDARTCLDLSITAPANASHPDRQDLTSDMVVTHVLKALHGLLSADDIRWVGDSRLLSADDFMLITASLPLPAATPPKAGPTATPPKPQPQPQAKQQAPAPQSPKRDRFDSEPNLTDLRAFLRTIDDEDAARRERVSLQTLSDPQRLAAWLMTYAVVLLAMPVGLALLLFNLIRGENPRLASQTAALTGTFIAFQTYGTTAQAMSAVQSLLF